MAGMYSHPIATDNFDSAVANVCVRRCAGSAIGLTRQRGAAG
jgi:hypothetical protein